MNDLDVYVLVYSGTRADWLEQCLASIRHQPCNLHVVQGVEGDIPAGRAIGFGTGTAPYVTYVDCDDWLLPGALEAVTRHMNDGHQAITTREYVSVGERYVRVRDDHHLFVVRRDCITPHLATYADKGRYAHCLAFMQSLVPAVRVATLAYVWREDGHGSHKKYKHGAWCTPPTQLSRKATTQINKLTKGASVRQTVHK